MMCSISASGIFPSLLDVTSRKTGSAIIPSLQVFSDHQADFAMVLPSAEDGKMNIVRIEVKSCMRVGQYVVNTLHEKGSL